MVSLPAYGNSFGYPGYPGSNHMQDVAPVGGYQVTNTAPTQSPAANDPAIGLTSTFPAAANYPQTGLTATSPTAVGSVPTFPTVGAYSQTGAVSPNAALGNWSDAGQVQQTPLDRMIIAQALNLTGQIRNLPLDEAYMHHLGVNPPLKSGAEALQIIQQKGIRVEFGDMGDSPAHAQWVASDNLIMINQRYRGDRSPATLYAISEAIYHEAGHAKDGDDQSSIQEELDCLSLNTLGHRYHKAIDPAYAQTASSSRLIADGVAIYDKLFFDVDPYKQGLINRVVTKYGDLPMWSPGHPVPPPVHPMPMAYRIAEKIDANNVARGLMPPSPALSQNPDSTQAFPTVSPVPQPQTFVPNYTPNYVPNYTAAPISLPGQQLSYVA